ncbi:MAG: pyridoxamine 5'-phosphate oxidase family protein [Haloarculaceae archaeon]
MTLEELEAVGITRMDETAIDDFLRNRGFGVLGLPDEATPYLLPMSYGFDGESLFFTYLLGEASRKEALSERADAASFLVSAADSPFRWQSVLLTGTIDAVTPSAFEAAVDQASTPWRPAIFREASLSRGVEFYRFGIDERSGVKHTGLPPALVADPAADDR